MSSSIREKIHAVEKQKKVERRLIKEQSDAIKKRQEPENNQPEYKEADVREIPTETSNSDSIIESKEEVKKTTNKKSKKKTSKKK